MIRKFTRLSSNYFWYFAMLGLVVPFLPVFLDARGFSSIDIGEMLAVVTAMKILAPSLWAQLADKSGQQLNIVRLGVLLALIAFTCLLWATSYWLLLLCLVMVNLFWTAVLPQLEVMTLDSIRRNNKIYGRIRLWGSIGFIVFAMGSGELMDRYSSFAFIYIGIFIFTGLLLSTLLSEQPHNKQNQKKSITPIGSKILHQHFLLFFFAGLLLQVSFGPYYVFFALYLQQLDYSGVMIGSYIALGVLAEIGIFMFISRFFKSFSLVQLISASIFITAIRWYLTGQFAEHALILAFSQLLHAASFGLYHSASIAFIQKHFHRDQQSRGQAFYISGVYGIGGVLGAYIAGLLWLDGQGATTTYQVAAVTAFVGGILALGIVKKKKVGL